MNTIKKYPDNTSYAEVETKESFTFRINNYEDLWHLNQILDVYRHKNIKPTVTLPNLLDAQADRRFSSNQSSGLKLVCQFLNSMYADFKIFHPHNSELVEGLMDNVEIIDNVGFIIKVLYELDGGSTGLNTKTTENLILFSSDAGGFKPLMKLCDKLNWQGEIYGASKARKYEDGKSKLIQVIDREDFGGKDILIIDDISVYGGTFVGLAKMLKERNCGKLYLAISHLTVENPNSELFTLFDKVFTTNSKNLDYSVSKGEVYDNLRVKPNNLEVIDLF